jgi:hypothetical protein
LHDKWARDGLVAVSVSLDEPSEKGLEEGVLKFLTSQKAAFTNLILDAPFEFWSKKFEFNSTPCVYVFNREGKWTRFLGEDKYADAVRLAESYMEKKPPGLQEAGQQRDRK